MAESPYFFQFRKIDNYLFQTLINRTLWFSSLGVFNDPFDCQLPVQVDNSLEEITKFLFSLNNERKYYSNKVAIVKRAKELYNDKTILKSFLNNKFFNERRFSCFVEEESLVYRNSKMWGDYADKNRGICLRFLFDNDFEKSFELDPGINISPLPILYKKGIPTFNYIRKQLGIQQEISSSNQYYLGVKSEDWKDESEVRIVIEKGPGQNFESEYVGVEFKPKYLKEVVLGCMSSKEDKETVQKIVRCNPDYSHVKFTELKKSNKWFGFDSI